MEAAKICRLFKCINRFNRAALFNHGVSRCFSDVKVINNEQDDEDFFGVNCNSTGTNAKSKHKDSYADEVKVGIQKPMQDKDLYKDNFKSTKQKYSKTNSKLNTPIENFRRPFRNTVQSQDNFELYRANAEVYKKTHRSFDKPGARVHDEERYKDNFESAKQIYSKRNLNTPGEEIRHPVRNSVQSQDNVELFEVYKKPQRSFKKTDADVHEKELYKDNFESSKQKYSKRTSNFNTPVEAPFRNTAQSQVDVDFYQENAKVYKKPPRSFNRTDAQSVEDESIHSTSDDSSAYNHAIRIREKIQKDNNINLVGKMNPKEYKEDGSKILKNQIPHLQNASLLDVLAVLQKSIIYNNNDIVAITKPYGLPSHGGPGIAHSVGDFVDDIIPKNTLYPVHRLDKETTGVMILAKSQGMAELLTEHFVIKRDVVKKYLVITKNIPEVEMGQIDIPLLEGTVDGRARMALRPYNTPELSAVMEKRSPGQTAITRYKVLSKGAHCALLECIPLTGKKHQVRVHLAFGLNCPILGDHKYALEQNGSNEIASGYPGNVTDNESGVRHLAMHLHARSIMIPNFSNGKSLFVSAPLPPHFVRNLNDLKLKMPPHT